MLKEYTGTNGVYAAYALHPSCHRLYRHLAEQLGFVDDDFDAKKSHVTVMYSPPNEAEPAPGNIEQLLEGMPDEIELRVQGVTSWVGHNDKEYVVITLLDAGDLQDLHTALIDEGCKPTFAPYRPHVTIGSREQLDDDLKAAILDTNLKLYRDRPVFKFHRFKVADIQ